MTDEKKPVSNKPVQVTKAPPPITPLRGGSNYRRPRVTTAKAPDWKTWQHYPKVEVWQACALALNIDPDSMKREYSWMAESHIIENESFPSDEHADSFDKLSRLLEANLGNRQHFTQPHDYAYVRLPEFAAWCLYIGHEVPPELAALAKAAPQAAEIVETAPVEQDAHADDDDYDQKLAALFDPMPVEALEKMFPATGKWKSWAEKARDNKLKNARETTARFNPYKAGVWFVNKGMEGWDIARLYRTLANNLPARSRDDAHLLTAGID